MVVSSFRRQSLITSTLILHISYHIRNDGDSWWQEQAEEALCCRYGRGRSRDAFAEASLLQNLLRMYLQYLLRVFCNVNGIKDYRLSITRVLPAILYVRRTHTDVLIQIFFFSIH